MQPPPGYDHPPNKVCRLQKALYGLKQSPLGEGFHYFTYLFKFLGPLVLVLPPFYQRSLLWHLSFQKRRD